MLFSDNQAESSLEEVMAVLAGRGRWPGRLSPAAKLSLPRSIRSQQRQADPALPALAALPALLSPLSRHDNSCLCQTHRSRLNAISP